PVRNDSRLVSGALRRDPVAIEAKLVLPVLTVEVPGLMLVVDDDGLGRVVARDLLSGERRLLVADPGLEDGDLDRAGLGLEIGQLALEPLQALARQAARGVRAE